MLRIKELNLTCMINDSERITEKLGQSEKLSEVKPPLIFIQRSTRSAIVEKPLIVFIKILTLVIGGIQFKFDNK